MANNVDPAIWSKIQEAFAEALGFDEDEINFDSKIIEELEAESLDFLDIAFRLERAFDVKIPRGGIEKTAREGLDGDGLNPDGTLTDESLKKLSEAMPEVPSEEFRAGMKPNDIPNLFRVGTFYHLIITLLAEKE
jgi:acyl carrier protein